MIIKTNRDMNEYEPLIKKEAGIFFRTMTFQLNSIAVTKNDDAYLIEINIDNPKTLIGERGQTLSEVQYLLRLLIRKVVQIDVFIELDINNYKKKKREVLNEIVKDIGDEVALHKREKILPPMSPYERRIVHLALKEKVGVETKSIGEGANRKVVIRPV